MVNIFNYLNYRKVEEQTEEMKSKILGDGGRGNLAQIPAQKNLAQLTAFSDPSSKVETIDKLKSASSDVEVSKIVNGMNFDPFLRFDEDAPDNGEMVYLMPMLQFPKIDMKDDYNFTLDLLE